MEADENYRVLADLIRAGFERGEIKQMPFEMLYEFTLSVAVGLAKRQIAGTLALDGEMLEWAADACCRAVQP